MKTKEIWKDIIGYEGYYEVSSLGSLRSVDRTIIDKKGNCFFKKGKLLSKSKTNGNGYCIARLCYKGIQKCVYFHRVVAEAFLGEIGDNVVNHKNGNKLDNNIENLEIVTVKQNCNHSLITGLTPTGEISTLSKLTNKQAEEVYLLAKEGSISQTKIAKKYDISQQTVSDIKIGKHRKYDKWRISETYNSRK